MSKLVTSTSIPASWNFVPLKELGDWSGGGTPSKAKPQYWQGGTIPWVSPKDMKTERISDSQDHITEEALSHSTASLINAESVLIVTRSGILRHTLPVAVNSVPVTVNQDLKALTPQNGIMAEYVAWALRAFSRDILHTCSKQGTTVNSVETSKLLGFEIPVAPRGQQAKIVAEIEKQFSRLDEAVASLKRVKANLKRYKAAVLNAAVEGKLTEEWRKQHPNVEPASKLLERILVERRANWEKSELARVKSQEISPRNENWKKRYKEAEPPKSDEVYAIPRGWVWTNLGQLSWSVKDGPHYSPKYSERGIPFISGGNIRPEGIDFSNAKYISSELHEELSERCKPEYGDLLYTKGGTTGIARINTERKEFNVWVHVAVLKLVDSIKRFYLQHALNSPHCYRQSQKYTHGGGNQDFGLTRMIWITVPLPSLEEQDEIIAEVERRLSVIEELEAAVEANLTRADRLRQSTLQQAFSGGLLSLPTCNRSSRPVTAQSKKHPLLGVACDETRILLGN